MLDSINRNKINYKSQLNELIAYFTTPSTILPQQQERFYKFNLGERIRLNLTKSERTALNFKYSLNFGELNTFFFDAQLLLIQIMCR